MIFIRFATAAAFFISAGAFTAQSADAGRVWYARLMAGDRMIPVRMRFDSAFGVAKGYLA
jgi:hypothetical protein